jgi:6-pyruvoyltetrahydropterin/6-carboxytetrahydropterin synthase
MYLTISKRFEFSASQRYYSRQWSTKKNLATYGKAAGAEHGFGANYTVFPVFHGPVDSVDGMVINVAAIKEKVKPVVEKRYDHKYLNLDTPPFDTLVPTPENLVRCLLDDVIGLFDGFSAQPVACHLAASPWRAATAYADGRVESHYRLEFSAARRTWSPRLSEEDNRRWFGIASAPGGHGHRYQLRATLSGEVDSSSGMIVPESEVTSAFQALHTKLDHRNLNIDLVEMKDQPMTTECLARFLFNWLGRTLPVTRVRLHETADFFAECHAPESVFIGLERPFSAAHRLHHPNLEQGENLKLYGKCNNPHGHGHLYRVEGTLSGKLDEASGTLYSLDQLDDGLTGALAAWDYRHLDLDTPDFRDRVSTAENMIGILYSRIDERFEGRLHRLRLWETPNNRFTLRRDAPLPKEGDAP